MSIPDRRHIIREVRSAQIRMPCRIGAISVRRENQLLRVGEGHWVVAVCYYHLSPPTTVSAMVPTPSTAVGYALDHNKPSWALGMHMSAEPLSSKIPVGRHVASAPGRPVRFIKKIGSDDIGRPAISVRNG
eukprot:scaffold284130_cov36-Tisochrysis_lutea.AAC.2